MVSVKDMKLTINFCPESDKQDFSQAISEYVQIWQEDGEKIVNALEKHTGLQFQESYIDAFVIDGASWSHPMKLRYSLTFDQKKYVLIHELGHRILYKRVAGMGEVSSLARHKFLFLVLGAVIKELYGDTFLTDAVARDCGLQEKFKLAWDWAFGFSDEEKQRIFKEVLNGNLSLIAD